MISATPSEHDLHAPLEGARLEQALARLSAARARLERLEYEEQSLPEGESNHPELAAAHWELSMAYQGVEQFEQALKHHQSFYLHDVSRRNERAQASVLRLTRAYTQQEGELNRQEHLLEQTVADYTAQLEATQIEMTELLASAAEFRDAPLGPHARWVGDASACVAQALGMGEEAVRSLNLAARLHDIGKLAIPDSVLLKKGKLSGSEWTVMRTHTVLGARLLAQSTSALLRLAAEVALSHHEHWDGSGYPTGLSAEEIPLSGRIVSVVDTYDALVSERPYKPAWTAVQALLYLHRTAGRQFDPQVVEVFTLLYEQRGLPER
ncbi:HD domain-containing protein [Deinococcus radiomollis]|uniref:HD-GYP domain-containing protein n=1 Tax=Deinococcus radiomollis TaxID=468916 RepID=UPI003892591F